MFKHEKASANNYIPRRNEACIFIEKTTQNTVKKLTLCRTCIKNHLGKKCRLDVVIVMQKQIDSKMSYALRFPQARSKKTLEIIWIIDTTYFELNCLIYKPYILLKIQFVLKFLRNLSISFCIIHLGCIKDWRLGFETQFILHVKTVRSVN